MEVKERTRAAEARIAELERQLAEAQERQTAISEILRVISSSPTDVHPVLDAIALNAARFAGAEDVSVFLLHGSELVPASHHGPIPVPLGVKLDRGSVTGRAVLEQRVVQKDDVTADQEYPVSRRVGELDGQRTVLAAPLVREGGAIGAIVARRSSRQPFTARQVELVRTFADQAAIAIENVRLFNETKESLERQTAIGEILRVITATPEDMQPVLEVIAGSARRYCSAEDAAVVLVRDGMLVPVAHEGPLRNASDLGDERELIHPFPLDRSTVSGRAVMGQRTEHVADLQAEETEYPLGSKQARDGGYHTVLATPLLREGRVLGVITLRRSEIRPFTGHQIGLATTFADQAVIAIENVRLFNETKEALERQTAISEILRVISQSPTDVQPVLDAIAQSAAKFCGAEDALVMLERDGELRAHAHAGQVPLPPDMSYPIDRHSMTGRSFVEGVILQVPDMLTADVAETYPLGHALAKQYGWRTAAVAPLLREGRAIGTLNLRRLEVRPFTEKQVELLQTFAAQAVIAIENVRLFNETSESLERQTAIAEVMKVIGGSMSESQMALDQVVAQATRLAEADNGFVYQVEGEYLRLAAAFGDKAGAMREWQRTNPIKTQDLGSATGRAFSEARTIHIEDVLADPTYTYRQAQQMGGFRVLLAVPMIREGKPLGVLALWRVQSRPFSAAQIKVVELFADQAVVAVENVRLFNETKEALERQTAISEILRVISSSPTDVQPVLDAIAESAMRFCAAEHAIVNLTDGSMIRPVAGHRSVLDPFPLDRSTVTGRSMVDIRTHSIRDLADAQHVAEFPLGHAQARRSGERAIVATPMVRDGRPIGGIVLWRTEPIEFTTKQVQLVETFASQAVIAIENVRLFNEIQDKSRQLEVASRHKSEFLANMSHELRTPLNAIIGFTDVMLEEMFGPLNDKQKEYLGDVRNSGTHLLTLINDILDLSKIEAGRIELEMAEFSFPEALENALTLVRERATRHGITLAAHVTGDVGRINADERKVKQVLVNLLANAVKFTPDGGRVTVQARRANGDIEVAVHDTGIGVATEDQERIFDEFQQVGRDPERSREGTGLGLTLAKRFIELHGGRIWVESEVGKGSTFTFAIPVRQTDLAGAKA